MAEQTDLGKTILFSGIALGVLSAGLGFFLTPSTPKGKTPNISAGNTDYIEAQAKDSSKTLAAIGVAKDGKSTKLDHMGSHGIADVSPDKNNKRISPLMVAPELWQVAIAAEKKNVIMDIYDEKAPEIHAGIPNVWFINNGLADALSISTGATMDSDNDGFSNIEEFKAGTKPNDAASAPALAGTDYIKLATVGSKKTYAYVHIDANDVEFVEKAELVNIKIFAKKDDTKPILEKAVKPGETFGLTAAEPERYKLLEIIVGSEGGVKILDTRNPKNGEQEGFIVKHSKKNRKKVEDQWATLTVTAGPKKGENVEVLIGETFTLPGADSVRCKVKAMNDDGSSQILIEGAKNEVTAPKAAK